MTGFGKSEVTFQDKSFVIQLKSVNSKSADVSIKLPGLFREKENEVRSFLSKELQRGKIDLYISTQTSEESPAFKINKSVLLSYFNDLKEISSDKGISDDVLFTLAGKMPNILAHENEEPDDEMWSALFAGIERAAQLLTEFRRTEGHTLEKDLQMRITHLLSLLEDIKPYESERIETIKSRLNTQLSQLTNTENVNRDRFEQELIYYIEKLDITEEKVRLQSHCKMFTDTMNETESQGRKLGFISQELGREINTIGSKANHPAIQKLVVEMKDELEKIKEQLFNIV